MDRHVSCSLSVFLNILVTLCFPHPQPPTHIAPLAPHRFPKNKFILREGKSENHLALSSGAPVASKSDTEPELWSFFFSLQALARIERVKRRKGERALECGSGSGGRNVSSLFVSVCGA